MNSPTLTPKKQISPIQGFLNKVWPYLTGKRGLIFLGGAVIIMAAAFNWSWLVTVGAASLIIAVLPCVAMCALGLCMSKVGGKSCGSDGKAPGKEVNLKGDSDGNA